MLSDSRADFWTAATARTVRRSPWTALRPGVVQHGEFHSAEHAGGETVSMAITSVLSRRSARRVSLRILHWLRTKNIRITVNLLGMCMPRRLDDDTRLQSASSDRGSARTHTARSLLRSFSLLLSQVCTKYNTFESTILVPLRVVPVNCPHARLREKTGANGALGVLGRHHILGIGILL
jgi:hypothetical protein